MFSAAKPFSTWLRFSGLPGCGKTSTIEALLERVKSVTPKWQKIICLPESVCEKELLAKFHSEPDTFAYELQKRALERYNTALRKLGVEFDKQHPSQPILVIEHTSLEAIHAFVIAYFRLGFLTNCEYTSLIATLKTIRRLRANIEKPLRKIWANFHKLEINEILKNITKREGSQPKSKRQKTMNENLLKEILCEVDFARSLIDDCFDSSIYWKVWRVSVEYAKDQLPMAPILNALIGEENNIVEY